MDKALSLYDEALESIPAKIDDKKDVEKELVDEIANAASSIHKNKAKVYQHLMQQLLESYFPAKEDQEKQSQIKVPGPEQIN